VWDMPVITHQACAVQASRRARRVPTQAAYQRAHRHTPRHSKLHLATEVRCRGRRYDTRLPDTLHKLEDAAGVRSSHHPAAASPVGVPLELQLPQASPQGVAVERLQFGGDLLHDHLEGRALYVINCPNQGGGGGVLPHALALRGCATHSPWHGALASKSSNGRRPATTPGAAAAARLATRAAACGHSLRRGRGPPSEAKAGASVALGVVAALLRRAEDHATRGALGGGASV